MPILSGNDLATHIYPEIITEITRGDTTIADHAIAIAIQETQMYLNKYNLEELFGSDPSAPDINNEYLISLIKDIACWRLIRLSNSCVNYEIFHTAYKDAIESLNDIMTGKVQPNGWSYATNPSDEIPTGDSITWNSNHKRNNYY